MEEGLKDAVAGICDGMVELGGAMAFSGCGDDAYAAMGACFDSLLELGAMLAERAADERTAVGELFVKAMALGVELEKGTRNQEETR